MLAFLKLSTLALFAANVFAAPQPLIDIQRALDGNVVPDRYIIKLKDGVSCENHLSWVKTLLGSGPLGALTGSILPDSENWTLINAYAGVFKGPSLLALRGSRDIEYIVEDSIMHTMETIEQHDAPWGLARLTQGKDWPLDQDPKATNYKYSYDSKAGEGVDVYIIDTGINTAHVDFGGRASWGATFGSGYVDADGNGHGTHCAGTAVGTRWGVAKKANVIAVKVLSDQGAGSISDIISGVCWVAAQAKASGRPSIASMSLGGLVAAAAPLNLVVEKAILEGVHFAVAAGNSNQDAVLTSPASAPSACTVGAANITDSRASFSNYGAIVDVFAPGVSVTSAWIGDNTATNRISGTSMATPHIAGLMAYLLSYEGQRAPKELIKRIQELALKDQLADIPALTPNYLAQSIFGSPQ